MNNRAFVQIILLSIAVILWSIVSFNLLNKNVALESSVNAYRASAELSQQHQNSCEASLGFKIKYPKVFNKDSTVSFVELNGNKNSFVGQTETIVFDGQTWYELFR